MTEPSTAGSAVLLTDPILIAADVRYLKLIVRHLGHIYAERQCQKRIKSLSKFCVGRRGKLTVIQKRKGIAVCQFKRVELQLWAKARITERG